MLRNLIVVDADDPNKVYDTRSIVAGGGFQPIGQLVPGVKRNFQYRIDGKLAGDISGDTSPDGKVDIQDLAKLCEEWLVSSEPEGYPAGTGNYAVSDINYDRITNLEDFVSIANTWLMEDFEAPAELSTFEASLQEAQDTISAKASIGLIGGYNVTYERKALSKPRKSK
jgi:hypothetical protein